MLPNRSFAERFGLRISSARENANGEQVENLDNRIGQGVPNVEREETAETKFANAVNFLTKSMEVRIHFLFQFLNTAESKDSEIEGLDGVLLPSNRYAIPEEEANDEAIWVDFADERKTIAESNKCDPHMKPIIGLYSAVVALKDSMHAQDVKKNILYIKSEIAKSSRAIEKRFCDDLNEWFGKTLEKNLEQYLNSNPTRRAYMNSIRFVESRIQFYEGTARNDRRSMAMLLFYNKLRELEKQNVLVGPVVCLEMENEGLETREQDFLSTIFGFKIEDLV